MVVQWFGYELRLEFSWGTNFKLWELTTVGLGLIEGRSWRNWVDISWWRHWTGMAGEKRSIGTS